MTAEEFKFRLLPARNKLFRFALSFLSNREEAEDAVQEVYLKMWKMRDDLGKYKSPEALMMTITRNHCLDKLKTKKNKAFTLNPGRDETPGENTHDLVEQTDMVSKVKQIIRHLPEQQRTVVHLRDVEGYAFEEITEITGYDLNYIRVNLSRGRKKIKETLLNLQRNETGRDQ